MAKLQVWSIELLTFSLIFGAQQPKLRVIAPLQRGLRIAVDCNPMKIEVQAMLELLVAGQTHPCLFESDQNPPDMQAHLLILKGPVRVGQGFQFDAEILFEG